VRTSAEQDGRVIPYEGRGLTALFECCNECDVGVAEEISHVLKHPAAVLLDGLLLEPTENVLRALLADSTLPTVG